MTNWEPIWLGASRSGFGASIGVAVLRNSIGFCNSCLQIMLEWLCQGSSLLRPGAKYCGFLQLRFVNCIVNGCMKVANGALAAVIFHFGAAALMIFLF